MINFTQSGLYQNGRTSLLKGLDANGKKIMLVAGGGPGCKFSQNAGNTGYIKLTINILIKNLL
jgi:hypothetical protein